MAAPAGMEGVSHHPPVMLFSNQTVGRGLAALALGASTVLAVQAAEMGAHSGMFQKAEAPVSGSFMIKTEAGKQVLVLSSDFKTNDSAPDLKVAFSPSAKPVRGHLRGGPERRDGRDILGAGPSSALLPAAMMERYGHEGFPVLDQETGKIVGIMSRREVDKARRHKLDGAPIRQFMKKGEFFVTPADGVDVVVLTPV